MVTVRELVERVDENRAKLRMAKELAAKSPEGDLRKALLLVIDYLQKK